VKFLMNASLKSYHELIYRAGRLLSHERTFFVSLVLCVRYHTYDLFNSVMKYFRLNIICIHHKDQRKKEANL
jgi:hypothetical protein